MVLVCWDTLIVMQKAKLMHHYNLKNAKLDKMRGQMCLDKVNALADQQAAFTRLHSDRNSVIQTRFAASKLIAKKLKLHSEGEFDKVKLFKSVSLSVMELSDSK